MAEAQTKKKVIDQAPNLVTEPVKTVEKVGIKLTPEPEPNPNTPEPAVPEKKKRKVSPNNIMVQAKMMKEENAKLRETVEKLQAKGEKQAAKLKEAKMSQNVVAPNDDPEPATRPKIEIAAKPAGSSIPGRLSQQPPPAETPKPDMFAGCTDFQKKLLNGAIKRRGL